MTDSTVRLGALVVRGIAYSGSFYFETGHAGKHRTAYRRDNDSGSNGDNNNNHDDPAPAVIAVNAKGGRLKPNRGEDRNGEEPNASAATPKTWIIRAPMHENLINSANFLTN